MSPTVFTPADVGRIRIGHRKLGPEPYGCMNTGNRPFISRQDGLHDRYIVGQDELRFNDAVFAFIFGDARRVWRGGKEDWQVFYCYKTRGPAVRKFLELCNARAAWNHEQREKHQAARQAAARGDIGAALTVGDFEA